MEKIKTMNAVFDIVSIESRGPLLEILFPKVTDLSQEDLTEIEVLTDGGVPCTNLSGYTTIYDVDGAKVTLSNDGSVYSAPEVLPDPEPYVPTEEELARQASLNEIAGLKAELEATDYKIIKCSEYQLAGLDPPYDIAALHADRQSLRDKINELELGLA